MSDKKKEYQREWRLKKLEADPDYYRRLNRVRLVKDPDYYRRRSRAWAARKKLEDPDYFNRASRKSIAKRTATPELREAHKAKNRAYQTQRRLEAGMIPRIFDSPEIRKAKQATMGRDRFWKLRIELLEAYGSQCACCGEPELRFLCLDHVDQGRPEAGSLGFIAGRGRPDSNKLYKWLKRQGWPQEGYQLLCWNCNSATRWGEPCPHAAATR